MRPLNSQREVVGSRIDGSLKGQTMRGDFSPARYRRLESEELVPYERQGLLAEQNKKNDDCQNLDLPPMGKSPNQDTMSSSGSIVDDPSC